MVVVAKRIYHEYFKTQTVTAQFWIGFDQKGKESEIEAELVHLFFIKNIN